MRPTSGLTFGGRYQLSSRVAIGGMGEVWEATDLVIGRTVAIKILKDEYLGDPGFLERFRAEARHAALVNHEGIANVYDYGEEDGSAYLVMELVPGEALSAILERERVLSSDRVLDIVAQTASALQAAHAAGLVHRDIKPGNLLITPDGRVKITDFGIARIADQVPLTATGQVMGTVQYLSPEQASGHPASPATDIYSLGIVAYEALAGRRPFTGESQVAIAMAQINEAAPELPVTIAEPVRNLVFSCIAKRPDDRPASAQHLARAAQSLRRGDVAAAATAVPAVLGSARPGTTAATTVLGAGAATTRVMPATQNLPLTEPAAEEPRRRSPWTWPLVALVGVLVVALVAAVIALLANPNSPEPNPSSSSPRPTQSTPSNTPTEPTTIDAAELQQLNGLTKDEAQDLLDSLGLELKWTAGDVTPSGETSEVAYRWTPSTGELDKGQTVTVYYYTDPESPPAPAVASVTPSASPQVGTEVTVRWNEYVQCIPGYDLQSYTVEVSGSGGTILGGLSTFPPDQRQVNILMATTPGTVQFTYYANCGAGLQSKVSPPLTITGTPAPVDTPSTPPTDTQPSTPPTDTPPTDTPPSPPATPNP
ncbi:serine/threonine-protein kinase [Galbitalea sp. SE-J8]|uniref:serine/threonine-protein kinase n=1 Tax=Galbitalea sp. SE-J8 TaxID=3054952 RepID=UPI00259CD6E0|nr:serine/threonine-protein kinase [Galbitalea sp. SE-J8]MDM4763279.1 serine/threonine-protein kinase [Galbitalea sp. SE-J8]